MNLEADTKVNQFWREVLIAAVRSGQEAQAAIDTADLALGHYRTRFIPSAEVTLPVQESLEVAMTFNPGGIGLRVAVVDGLAQLGTVKDFSGQSAKQNSDMVLVRWDQTDEDGQPVDEWVPVSCCVVVNLPHPDQIKELNEDAKALLKKAA